MRLVFLFIKLLLKHFVQQWFHLPVFFVPGRRTLI